MKNIYIINSCNDWKEYSSMSLVMATTSLRKVKSCLIQKIKDGDMEYERNSHESKTAQIKLLKKDWEDEGVDFVFDHMKYGYVESVLDGEIQ